MSNSDYSGVQGGLPIADMAAQTTGYDAGSDNVQMSRPQPVQAPSFSPVPVDTTELLKAQSLFIAAQTWFLEEGASMHGDDYTKALSRYSRAQSDLIRAQSRVLHALGVV
jgi:hypothetical protein